jgi:hypothetical protein
MILSKNSKFATLQRKFRDPKVKKEELSLV